MNKASLARELLGMADDELILAHRNSEWSGHAPILEEDIAFTNIALDELGHAMVWYSLSSELLDEDPEAHPDRLVYGREMSEYRNVQMVELPKGDWALSMLRQYLFDAYEAGRLQALTLSQHAPLAEAAAKIRGEEAYHLRHSAAWIARLGRGTDESNRRLQEALDALYPYALQLFEASDAARELAEEGLIPDANGLGEQWTERVHDHLTDSGLSVPNGLEPVSRDRSVHTKHMQPLLVELQEVARLESGVEW